MVPVFLAAAGVLALFAVGGGKKSSKSEGIEGIAADAALDEILDDEYVIPDGVIIARAQLGNDGGPSPRPRSKTKTRSGPKRTKAKRMALNLPKIRKVDWSKELRGRSGSSRRSRLNHPECTVEAPPSTMAIQQARFVTEIKGAAIIKKLPVGVAQAKLTELNRT